MTSHMVLDTAANIYGHFERHLDRMRSFVRQPSISGKVSACREMAALVAASIQELGDAARWCPRRDGRLSTCAAAALKPSCRAAPSFPPPPMGVSPVLLEFQAFWLPLDA